jgi:hypothetical protein
MRPRRRERKRGPQGQGSSQCLLNLRNPSLILNAGLLASALTNLADANGKGKKKRNAQQNGGQGQNHIYSDSRSASHTDLSYGDENHQNTVSEYAKKDEEIDLYLYTGYIYRLNMHSSMISCNTVGTKVHLIVAWNDRMAGSTKGTCMEWPHQG